MIMDLSWSHQRGITVNGCTPKEVYRGSVKKMHIPTAADMINLIQQACKGCFLYCCDIVCTYCQLLLDPGDCPLVCLKALLDPGDWPLVCLKALLDPGDCPLVCLKALLDPGDWPLVCLKVQELFFVDVGLPFGLR